MGRPKGSKNKIKNTAVSGGKELDEQILRVKERLDTLTSELTGLTSDVRVKRQEIRGCRRELGILELSKEQANAAEEECRRQKQAQAVAEAFLQSGRSVEEALAMFRG